MSEPGIRSEPGAVATGFLLVRIQTMWNDTDIPVAVFFTLRCYGTWLHGDERGSVDRNNNVYRSARIPPNSHWKKFVQQELLHPPVSVGAAERNSVERAI